MKDYTGPNFDDERTILSARRVVPLAKIEKRARHRRQWFLGGAFTLAMMLGAATALVSSYLKHRNAPQAAVESAVVPDVAPAPVAVAASSPSDTPVIENEPTPESAEETAPPETPKRESPKRRVVAVRPNPEPDKDRDTTNMSESERLNRIRDAVLYDEWQERRARRVLRRERRSDRYNHRDLSNLNEIFEGRRRP